ncbi:MAG: DUF4268 domain-containing protein [Aeromicrobium sp.]|uniref:DUF4268 domain-containing protein n=1 Tax=Aeromicrobium sp. TaxID=1871063 RepID=UPI002626476D|nr:DUF4268 domain-containing protein [Aeromicrobium sp.]MDF1705973.1 DUF4268 domain-containing protein [Aeromicrobium sp.]
MTTGPALGRIEIVPPRQVWPHEALDFTPWLLANVDVLSDLLGMGHLVLEGAEHAVGNFSLDLIGKDESTGEVVIVENQLEVSDHLHLGQILTYAAGTDPTTIVWVATGFRPEHREAIAWLNDRTDERTRFFAVQIEVIRIGSSQAAPAFKLVAQPNDWAKQVKAAAAHASGEVTEREHLYLEFWEKYRLRVLAEHPTWTRASMSSKSSWFGMSAGVSGVNWISTFSQSGLGLQLVFEHADRDLNVARFDALAAQHTTVEAAFGGPLSWEPREGLKSSRIATYTDVADVALVDQWDSWVDWLIEAGVAMRHALTAAGGVPLPAGLPDTSGDVS